MSAPRWKQLFAEMMRLNTELLEMPETLTLEEGARFERLQAEFAAARRRWREEVERERELVHVVHGGDSRCGMSLLHAWPPTHRWVRTEEADRATCPGCRAAMGASFRKEGA